MWKPPAVMAGMTIDVIHKVLDEIDAAPADFRFSAHRNAKKRSVLPILTKHIPDCTEARASKIVERWLKSGLLVYRDYKDKVQRKDVPGLFVGDAKRPRTLSEMLNEVGEQGA